TVVCGPVARVRRLRRNPGMRRNEHIGAAFSRWRCAYLDYGFTAVCGPVARTGASSAASGEAGCDAVTDYPSPFSSIFLPEVISLAM
ncbi:TPA: hypothetical protein ACTW9E_004157, partial [Klebsiella michiganensis]